MTEVEGLKHRRRCQRCKHSWYPESEIIEDNIEIGTPLEM
jgi:hypothetical protein